MLELIWAELWWSIEKSSDYVVSITNKMLTRDPVKMMTFLHYLYTFLTSLMNINNDYLYDLIPLWNWLLAFVRHFVNRHFIFADDIRGGFAKLLWELEFCVSITLQLKILSAEMMTNQTYSLILFWHLKWIYRDLLSVWLNHLYKIVSWTKALN